MFNAVRVFIATIILAGLFVSFQLFTYSDIFASFVSDPISAPITPTPTPGVSNPVTPTPTPSSTPVGCVSCPTNAITVSGKVFVDFNVNGVQDSDETVVSNVPLRLERNGQEVSEIKTDQSGLYSFTIAQSSSIYTITVVLPDGTSDTNGSYIAFNTDANITHNFGIKLVGDTDNNRRVDIFDYNQVITDFGTTGQNIAGDLDRDGDVDIYDFNIIVTYFGKHI